MIVSLPDSNEIISNEDQLTTTPWFTFFQDVWKAIRGGLGISIGGTISTNTTSASNSGSGETTMITYTVTPMLNNGDEIYIKAWGTYAANANNKTIKLKFGSQTILDTGAVAANDGSWQIEASIIRTAAATQEIIATIISSNSNVAESATRTAGTQDLTTSNALLITGQGTSSDDIVQNAMLVKLTPND